LREPREIEIEPASFRSAQRQSRSSSLFRWLIWLSLGVVLAIMAASAWFVFTAKQVRVQIDPEPDRIALSGGWLRPNLGDYYLLRPGNYYLNAVKQGYQPMQQPIAVGAEKSQTISLVMERLPGLVTLRLHQLGRPSVSLDGIMVQVDGKEMGATPIEAAKVKQGRRRVEIHAEKYQDFQAEVVIDGGGVTQSFDFALEPAWADITIHSVPEGAQVKVDGSPVGATPLQVEILAGTHELELSAAHYQVWRTRLVVQANQPQVLDKIRLQPANGKLVLRTTPPGASVTIGRTYLGQTPLETGLRPNKKHVVQISKAGYEKVARVVSVSSDALKELKVVLVPILGDIHLVVEPSEAELFVNGKSWGATPDKLNLPAIEHQLEIKKDGYESYRTRITPQPGFVQELKIALKRLNSKNPVAPAVIRAANGSTLKLIRPAPFTMGSSRREQGRRSNETLREIILQRPFYLGIKEVTNAEFRQFLAEHNAGMFKGHSLNKNDQPVVQVSWEQAARFCNWLSEKESLPPAYLKRGNRLVPASPLPTGYRLPTEAEWEYCARFTSNKAALKYPWGNTFPPPAKSVNIADLSARDLLSYYLEKYDDGYPVTAPPGAFKANDLGLYDVGGNVAEWCHDYYIIYPYSPNKSYIDPTGPAEGKHRVVRGSSWKQASIGALRLSYRDYSNAKRPDLGFRICRYATDIQEEK
jgi:formylglycine-generating enzyme required for sulfatase activity